MQQLAPQVLNQNPTFQQVAEQFNINRINPTNGAALTPAGGQIQSQLGMADYDIESSMCGITLTGTIANAVNEFLYVRADTMNIFHKQQAYLTLEGEGQIQLYQDLASAQKCYWNHTSSKKFYQQVFVKGTTQVIANANAATQQFGNAGQDGQTIPCFAVGQVTSDNAANTFSTQIFIPFKQMFPGFGDLKTLKVQQQLQIVVNYLAFNVAGADGANLPIFFVNGGGANGISSLGITLTGINFQFYMKKCNYIQDIPKYIPYYVQFLYENSTGFQQNQTIPPGFILQKMYIHSKNYVTTALVNSFNIDQRPQNSSITNYTRNNDQTIFATNRLESGRMLQNLNKSEYQYLDSYTCEIHETFSNATLQNQFVLSAAGSDLVLGYQLIKPLA